MIDLSKCGCMKFVFCNTPAEEQCIEQSQTPPPLITNKFPQKKWRERERDRELNSKAIKHIHRAQFQGNQTHSQCRKSLPKVDNILIGN
jgi:hypothetical protein